MFGDPTRVINPVVFRCTAFEESFSHRRDNHDDNFQDAKQTLKAPKHGKACNTLNCKDKSCCLSEHSELNSLSYPATSGLDDCCKCKDAPFDCVLSNGGSPVPMHSNTTFIHCSVCQPRVDAENSSHKNSINLKWTGFDIWCDRRRTSLQSEFHSCPIAVLLCRHRIITNNCHTDICFRPYCVGVPLCHNYGIINRCRFYSTTNHDDYFCRRVFPLRCTPGHKSRASIALVNKSHVTYSQIFRQSTSCPFYVWQIMFRALSCRCH